MEIRPNAPAPLDPLGPTRAPRVAAPAQPGVEPVSGRPAFAMAGWEEPQGSLVGDEGDFGAMPWDAGADAPASPNEPLYARATDLGLTADGVALMRELEASGRLAWGGAMGRRLGEEVVWRLEHGFVDGPLAEALLRQIRDPDAHVRQVGPSTCAAATAQKAMAQNDPALYFVTAADLVRTGGGNLPDGSLAQVSGANRAWIDGRDLAPEAVIDATVQAALMDFANGRHGYDLAQDLSVRGDGTTYAGLGQQAVTTLNRATLRAPTLDPSAALADFEARRAEAERQPADALHLIDAAPAAAPMPTFMEVVMEHLRASRQRDFPGVFVPIETADGAHMVLVRDVDERARTLTMEDATGTARAVGFEQFVAQVAFAPGDGDGGIGSWSGTSTAARTTGTRR